MEKQQRNTIFPILLFDGVCNLCNGTVNFILDHDRKKILHFASLQSQVGQQLLKEHDLPTGQFDSVVLVEKDKYFVKSSAALRAMQHMGGIFSVLAILRVIPRFLRDPVYSLIARNRYRWFGKREYCRRPTPETKERILE